MNSARGNSESRFSQNNESEFSSSSKNDEIEEGTIKCKPYISKQKCNLVCEAASCRTSYNGFHTCTENAYENDLKILSNNSSVLRQTETWVDRCTPEEHQRMQKLFFLQQQQIEAMSQQIKYLVQRISIKEEAERRTNRSSTIMGVTGIENNLTLPPRILYQDSNSLIKSTKKQSNQPKMELESSQEITICSNRDNYGNAKIVKSVKAKGAIEEKKRTLTDTQKIHDSVEKGNISVTDFTVRMAKQQPKIQSANTNQIGYHNKYPTADNTPNNSVTGNSQQDPTIPQDNNDALSAIKETNESIYSPNQDTDSSKKRYNSRQRNAKVYKHIKY